VGGGGVKAIPRTASAVKNGTNKTEEIHFSQHIIL
jgi:hypothetical protein